MEWCAWPQEELQTESQALYQDHLSFLILSKCQRTFLVSPDFSTQQEAWLRGSPAWHLPVSLLNGGSYLFCPVPSCKTSERTGLIWAGSLYCLVLPLYPHYLARGRAYTC